MNGPILIVGGGQGIGAAIAADAGPAAAVWTRSRGVDAGDRAALTAAFARLRAERGVPWALVHTIGDFVETPLLQTGVEQYEALVHSNLTTLFHTLAVVVPALVEQRRGRVVLFAAAGTDRQRAMQRAPWYFALKAAVVQVARSLAGEVAAAGVTVNVISPGLIEHPHSHRDSQARLRPRVPIGRLGTVADIVALVRWLASDASAYVTGENFTVDGGLQL
ncbi:MAG: SDR family oxidoreductase [Planctomycetes bacterium]|nr:SDR family oxidoreductase [Planctomycetota bacterium]